MKKNKDRILEYIRDNTPDAEERLFETQMISDVFGISRANVSTALNQLVKSNDLFKTSGKPVKYGLRKGDVHNPDDAFGKLIGINGSLKNAVRLAKAFVLYPEKTLALISGEPGCGQYLLAKSIYNYAVERHVLKENAQFIILNMELYPTEDSIVEAFKKEIPADAEEGVIYIEHLEAIDEQRRRDFAKVASSGDEKLKYIIVCSKETSPGMKDSSFNSEFAFRIDLPSLNKRPFEERLELVEYFFRKESEKVNREIVINSELLRCFLMYRCPGNVSQLKDDIRSGCANAFVREIGNHSKQLHVYMSDCHPYVRKGFLFYKENRDRIEKLIPANYTYTFNPREGRKEQDAKKSSRTSIYESIDEKVRELKIRSISEEEIRMIVSADIESDMKSFNAEVEEEKYDRTAIEKIIDPLIVEAVDMFLKQASARFNRVYSSSVFHALCFQLSSSLSDHVKKSRFSEQKISEVIANCADEYTFASAFLIDLSQKLNASFSGDDCVLIALYLSGYDLEERNKTDSAVLIVMHGKVASALQETIHAFYPNRITYAYDLLLEEKPEVSYENIKQLCLDIAGTGGILVFYDMGSLKKIMEMISSETGIRMRMIELPVTLLALDAVLKFGMNGKLDEVYDELISSGFGSFSSLKELYMRQSSSTKKVIVTLCMSGSGSAVQMKQYLERNLDMNDVEVYAMAVDDRSTLIEKLNYYSRNNELLCIVGTYDPHIHGVPYISVARLFDTPADKLEMLLSLETTSGISDFDYKELYDYLEEQLQFVPIHSVRNLIHKTIREMKKKIRYIDSGEEVGLFMHLACALDRIASGEQLPVNVRKDNVISHHKKMYNDLQDILRPLEEEMDIRFGDDEIATIIDILR